MKRSVERAQDKSSGVKTKVEAIKVCNIPESQKSKTEVEANDIVHDLSVAKALSKMINANVAPPTDNDVFNGNPLDYDYFRATFQDAI